MGIEYIHKEANPVWHILNRGDYSDRDASDIEAMYNFMIALKEFAGDRVIKAISIYSMIYNKEFRTISDILSKDDGDEKVNKEKDDSSRIIQEYKQW